MKKNQRDRKRGGSKKRTIVIELTPEENEILCKQASDYKNMSSGAYARFMFFMSWNVLLLNRRPSTVSGLLILMIAPAAKVNLIEDFLN